MVGGGLNMFSPPSQIYTGTCCYSLMFQTNLKVFIRPGTQDKYSYFQDMHFVSIFKNKRCFLRGTK